VDDVGAWQMDHLEPLSKSGEHCYTKLAGPAVIRGSFQPGGSGREERLASARQCNQERRAQR